MAIAPLFVQHIVFTRLDVSMNKKIMNDLILISSILVISIVAFLAFTISLKNGENAIITVNGEKVAVLDLRKDTTKKIDTKFGFNEIKIEDGAVSVISADCPDKICADHRQISKVGQTIVCLPHKLVVEISEVDS